jgi:hypothetical protein
MEYIGKPYSILHEKGVSSQGDSLTKTGLSQETGFCHCERSSLPRARRREAVSIPTKKIATPLEKRQRLAMTKNATTVNRSCENPGLHQDISRFRNPKNRGQFFYSSLVY